MPVRDTVDPQTHGLAAGRGALTAFFGKRVRVFMRPAVMTVHGDTPLANVVAEMAAGMHTSAVVVDASGAVDGIFTERDIVRRVALRGIDERPVREVATRPVQTIMADDLLFRAVARMRRLDLRHLPVVDAQGRPVGMIDLVHALSTAAEYLLRQIDRLIRADTLNGLTEVKRAEAGIVEDLLAEKVPASQIAGVVSELNHDLHARVLAGAIGHLADAGRGHPPTPVTLLVMGSGGRGESLLSPDQDNGFILGDYPDGDHVRHDPYFIALAERVNDDLARIGFPLCEGQIMARNPVWRKTSRQWRDQIDRWAVRRDPVAARFGDAFLDFRAVAGPTGPADALRHRVLEAVSANRAILSVMCREAPPRRVALGWFGRIKSEKTASGTRRVNLKACGIRPLIASVRLWALAHGIEGTATAARIDALASAGVFGADDADGLRAAFDRIAAVILRQQIADIRAGRPATNDVDLKLLRRRERVELADALRAVERFSRETDAAFSGQLY